MGRLVFIVLSGLSVLSCRPQVRPPSGEEASSPPLERKAMDRSASGCTDFYEYACGRWVADTALPPDRVRLVRGESELSLRNARRLRRLLEDAGAGNVDPSDRFGRKAGDFYAACMDEVDVEARGLAELQAEWAEVDAAGDLGALVDELARMEALGVEVPFRLEALPSAENPTAALLVIAPGRLALPEFALAAGPDASAPYLEVVQRLFQHAGESAADALEDAEGVRELEAALLEGRLIREEASAAARLHSRVDRDGLAMLSPNVPWERFLRGVGAASLEAFGVADPAYLSRVGQLLGEVPLSRWKSYLRFRLEEEMARDSALPSTLVEDRAELERLSGRAALVERARWEACVDATVKVFGAGVGEAFGRKYLGREGREGASALLSALRRSLLQRVGAVAFMDAATRTRAASKLDRMAVLVGYGGEVPDYGAVRVQRDSYFRDLLSARRFLLAQEVARAGRGVDRGEWVLGPAGEAAHFDLSRNLLVLPAGLFQAPLIDPEASSAVAFGTVGARVGRALLSALEGEGRYYDGAGKVADWWSKATASEFLEKLSCLRGQEGGSDDGAALEGLADEGGLRLSFEAMRADRASHPEKDRSWHGLSPDEQFFLGWAQSLCAVGAGEDGEGGAKGAGGARRRVNGAVANLSEFSLAFRCGRGAALNRSDRCEAF